ncbi:hypothetical protein EVAR_89850_1 [Eumeta japonica]|uniref:Uncharacterized protein n=1 Tax=Eumeta variegata TaxID=151549 RepID=A0A4C1ZY25_EUMVA|nr:hypothetical protein EVAR_89850_1 [Eumeta japonica]
MLCYIGSTPGSYGVGFIIHKSLKNNIVSFIGITERVAILNMNIGPLGKRRRGRPLTRWEEDHKRSAGSDWYSRPQDRQKWTSLEEAFAQTGILVNQ